MAYGPSSLGGATTGLQGVGTGTRPQGGTSAISPWGWAGIGLGGLGVLGGLAGLMSSGGPDFSGMSSFLQRRYGADRLLMDQEKLYQNMLANPALQQMLNAINLQGSQFQSRLGGGLAASGMNTTGTGKVMSALAPSISMFQRQGVYGKAWEQSGQLAQQLMLAQLQALQGMPYGPSFGDYLSQLLGAGFMGGSQILASKRA